MYHKLALRNIRRSVRDYAVYFITLLLGVALFYAFNSIESQQILFDLESSSGERQFETTQQILSMFSSVIACVLAFLILYSNRFLIRRRKQEFGTYLLLGMTPARVSSIVLYETVIVGLASLAVGLLLGVILSQGLSFFTASLLGTTMKDYQFVFSFDGLCSTLFCFAMIYVVVALFNVITVSRCKLIDLLYADKKNERTGVRNPWACFGIFIASIGVLIYAYQQLIESGLVMLDDPRFVRATVGMLVGSLMFFWSLAGFVIGIITKLKGVYFRGLRVFTVRQIASKVNTAFLSLWAVCVLLFFSITVFSTGMGMVEVFVGGVEKSNPYDASLEAAIWYGPDGTPASSSSDPLDRRAEMQEYAPDRLAAAESNDWDLAAPLMNGSPELWDETIAEFTQVNYFSDPVEKYGDIFAKLREMGQAEGLDLPSFKGAEGMELCLLPLSEYNASAQMQGKEPIELEGDQCALVNNMEMSDKVAKAILKSIPSIEVPGRSLALADRIYDTQLEDNAMTASAMIFVVPDDVTDALLEAGYIPDKSVLAINYVDNGKTPDENDAALFEIVATIQPKDGGGFNRGTIGSDEIYSSLLWPVTRILTANEMLIQASGLRFMITYLALYIGFIFLISTAAILAIQQLSQTSDSASRYRILWKLGCDRSMIFRSLLAQVMIYFLVPLGLALCHCACAISVISDTLFDAMGVSTSGPIAMTAGLTLLIYGTYMIVTYVASRGITRGALAQG